jgi:hypothetical protein
MRSMRRRAAVSLLTNSGTCGGFSVADCGGVVGDHLRVFAHCGAELVAIDVFAP